MLHPFIWTKYGEFINHIPINLAGKYKIATGDYDGIIEHFAIQIKFTNVTTFNRKKKRSALNLSNRWVCGSQQKTDLKVNSNNEFDIFFARCT